MPTIPYFPVSSHLEWTDFRYYGLRSATAYVLVFDLSNQDTFQVCTSWDSTFLEIAINHMWTVCKNFTSEMTVKNLIYAYLFSLTLWLFSRKNYCKSRDFSLEAGKVWFSGYLYSLVNGVSLFLSRDTEWTLLVVQVRRRQINFDENQNVNKE